MNKFSNYYFKLTPLKQNGLISFFDLISETTGSECFCTLFEKSPHNETISSSGSQAIIKEILSLKDVTLKVEFKISEPFTQVGQIFIASEEDVITVVVMSATAGFSEKVLKYFGLRLGIEQIEKPMENTQKILKLEERVSELELIIKELVKSK